MSAFKTLSVLFVGIGIKLALYMPDAPIDAHFADDQRLQLGLSLAVCFGLELVMRPLHVGVKRYYSPETLLKRSKTRTAVIAIRALLNGAMVAVAAIKVQPWAFVWVEASFALLACGLAHYQHFQLSLKDIEEYVAKKRDSAITDPKHRSSIKVGSLG